jgi:hypothetical protein
MSTPTASACSTRDPSQKTTTPHVVVSPDPEHTDLHTGPRSGSRPSRPGRLRRRDTASPRHPRPCPPRPPSPSSASPLPIPPARALRPLSPASWGPRRP